MSNSNVTLKQIAALAGVSITTVHRVLNNKEGCSEQLKKKILQIAQEQGYQVNYAAASIRKHTLYFGLVFPATGQGHSWFLQPMMDGYLRYRQEAGRFNVVFQEHYIGSSGDPSLYGGNDMNAAVAHILRNIVNERPVAYDGLLLYDIDWNDEVLSWLHRLLGRDIPVVMLEKGPADVPGLCRVNADDETAGRMAAELLSKFVHGPGTVALVEQQLHNADPCGAAFARELVKRRPDLTLRTATLPADTHQTESVCRFLNDLPALQGVYCTSARHTVAYLAARPGLNCPPPVAIGSELFDRTHAALQDGTLDAVIDKRPFSIGYQALNRLFDHVVKNEPLPEVVNITPRIILRANCDAYFNRKDSVYGKHNHDIEPPICP